MSRNAAPGHDPRTFRALTFHAAAQRFREEMDTPRAYLERCLETICIGLSGRAVAVPGAALAAAGRRPVVAPCPP